MHLPLQLGPFAYHLMPYQPVDQFLHDIDANMIKTSYTLTNQ